MYVENISTHVGLRNMYNRPEEKETSSSHCVESLKVAFIRFRATFLQGLTCENTLLAHAPPVDTMAVTSKNVSKNPTIAIQQWTAQCKLNWMFHLNGFYQPEATTQEKNILNFSCGHTLLSIRSMPTHTQHPHAYCKSLPIVLAKTCRKLHPPLPR